MITYKDTIKVRISDINYGNHLGHTQLINLLHEIRLRFLKKYGLSEHTINNNMLFVGELRVKYLNQAFWDNELEVSLRIEQINKKIFFNYEVYNLTLNNKTSEAEITMLLVDKTILKTSNTNLISEILKYEADNTANSIEQ